jgi:hypothetical protein
LNGARNWSCPTLKPPDVARRGAVAPLIAQSSTELLCTQLEGLSDSPEIFACHTSSILCFGLRRMRLLTAGPRRLRPARSARQVRPAGEAARVQNAGEARTVGPAPGRYDVRATQGLAGRAPLARSCSRGPASERMPVIFARGSVGVSCLSLSRRWLRLLIRFTMLGQMIHQIWMAHGAINLRTTTPNRRAIHLACCQPQPSTFIRHIHALRRRLTTISYSFYPLDGGCFRHPS